MKQRNNKPLFILGGLIVLFIVFFWVITIESTFSKFKKDVLKSVSFIQIKSVYTTYSEELSNNPDFLSISGICLKSFNASKISNMCGNDDKNERNKNPQSRKKSQKFKIFF